VSTRAACACNASASARFSPGAALLVKGTSGSSKSRTWKISASVGSSEKCSLPPPPPLGIAPARLAPAHTAPASQSTAIERNNTAALIRNSPIRVKNRPVRLRTDSSRIWLSLLRKPGEQFGGDKVVALAIRVVGLGHQGGQESTSTDGFLEALEAV